MLYAFGFDRVGVLVSDMYIVIPNPRHGQEGAERGVRLEVRLLERGELLGSIYSARPIEVGRPVWRADLLEAVDGPPGSLNRAHHHPAFRGWEPGRRVFDAGLTARPVAWVREQLADLEGLLERAGVPADEATAADAKALRGCLPEILDTVGRLLERVRDGELAAAPGEPAASARVGWL
jgi:hypothetical protein